MIQGWSTNHTTSISLRLTHLINLNGLILRVSGFGKYMKRRLHARIKALMECLVEIIDQDLSDSVSVISCRRNEGFPSRILVS